MANTLSWTKSTKAGQSHQRMEHKDSCPPFMLKLAQLAQSEWHITQICTDKIGFICYNLPSIVEFNHVNCQVTCHDVY